MYIQNNFGIDIENHINNFNCTSERGWWELGIDDLNHNNVKQTSNVRKELRSITNSQKSYTKETCTYLQEKKDNTGKE